MYIRVYVCIYKYIYIWGTSPVCQALRGHLGPLARGLALPPMVILGRWVFLMSKVPLYGGTPSSALQGFLAHKTPPPLGPYSRTKPRALWRS